MNIFKKIWEKIKHELKRDPIKEAVESGYKLGRKHQKEEDDYFAKYHTFSGGLPEKKQKGKKNGK